VGATPRELAHDGSSSPALPARNLYGQATSARPPRSPLRALLVRATPAPAIWSAFCLDPAYHSFLAVLEGVFAARENPRRPPRRDLVLALRKGLRTPAGRVYPDSAAGDQAFFHEGVFVVTPTTHRSAIQHALGSRRTWKSVPFVDTVTDAGPEADAVVVSYGVSDPSSPARGKFLYSRTGGNVSITAPAPSASSAPRAILDASLLVPRLRRGRPRPRLHARPARRGEERGERRGPAGKRRRPLVVMRVGKR